jgi:hypothetical protein
MLEGEWRVLAGFSDAAALPRLVGMPVDGDRAIADTKLHLRRVHLWPLYASVVPRQALPCFWEEALSEG